MISIVLLALVGASLAQYPHQVAPSAPHQGYQYQPQPQTYAQQQPAYQPQSYSPPQQQRVYNPAAVHYVNIGSQLQGDYKFGYDTGKGDAGQSFREETRLPDGSVQGAYGYVDETGKQRIVKYTAGKDGYRAEGDGIGPAGNPQPVANPHAAQAPPAGYPNTNYVGNGYQQYSG